MQPDLAQILQNNASLFHPVVNFDPFKDKLLHLDFSDDNKELTSFDYCNTDHLSTYINQKLKTNNCTYGIGGYGEKRVFYKRSQIFNSSAEPREIHLGIDIWAPVGTKVMAPVGGMVHSFAFNNNFGDYGATIILQHQLETVNFYTLYGHLSMADLIPLRKGSVITRGEVFAHFGTPGENGNWPPHLHFQVIEDIGFYEGDYPGVCSKRESDKYLKNCPDPDLILKMIKYTK